MKKDHENAASTQSPLIASYETGNFENAGSALVEIVPVTTMTVPPYTTTNAIFFGYKAFWVIDPGTPHDDQRLMLRRYIDSRRAKGQKFLGICLTHHHGDHTRAAQYLADHYFVLVFSHPACAVHLKFPIRPLIDAEDLACGDEPSLTSIHTPGHADDHVVYYQKECGILLAGDMITDRGTVLIPPVGGSLTIYLESLKKLSNLYLTAIVPAHGKAIIDEPNLFLFKAMRHRYQRIADVFSAIKHQNAHLDATDITRLVYRDSIAENLLVFAQLSVESSLHWLKEAGLVENPHHLWQITNNAHDIEQKSLLNHLEEIDERLRNS